jgi:rhamnogalacturonyl hydrolase YesR
MKWVRGAMLLSTAVVLTALAATGAPAKAQSGTDEQLRMSLNAVAALAGEPGIVSAGGVTRDETPLLTIENPATFNRPGAERRLVLVGGLDGDVESARAVVEAVRWFKTAASADVRARWAVSALPLADPGGQGAARPYRFPPDDGFFDDPDRPESHYVWRWVRYQVPDLVAVVSAGRAGGALRVTSAADAEASEPGGALAIALSSGAGELGLGSVEALQVTARATDGEALMRELLGRVPATPSALRRSLDARVNREPLAIARLLAGRYPGAAGMSYIPGVAWVHTLRLGMLTGEPAWRAKVIDHVRPWLSGDQPLVGNRVSFAGLGGAMVFAELGKEARAEAEAAAALTRQAVALGRAETAPGQPEHGSGWTDDMFLGTITASLAGDAEGLDAATRLVTDYAGRLQRPEGIFDHAPDAPVPWGRGNGFAALGLAELLTALPTAHGARSAVLDIYRRQMDGMRNHQAPDGMWFQVVDTPGSYREASVTALTVTAMARGIRQGWLDPSFRSVVERGWRALLAHVQADGTLVDVCISTGAGPTRRYYLDRPAVNGADDRGGALVLGAALEVHALTQ